MTSRKRLKLGIYLQPNGEGIGGAEAVSIDLVLNFLPTFDVTLIHHRENFDIEDVEEFFDCELRSSNFTFLYIPFSETSKSSWGRTLSKPYDYFVNITHAFPPKCYATHSILYVLFPLSGQEVYWPWNDPNRGLIQRWKRLSRDAWHQYLWRLRFLSYEKRWCISKYTQKWTEIRWHFKPEIVHSSIISSTCKPTLDQDKRPVILSVARITPWKRQREMAEVFADQIADRLPNWQYHLIGPVSSRDEDQIVLNALHSISHQPSLNSRIRVSNDMGKKKLLESFSEARLFWHGMGWLTDPAEPERFEHFGIVLVEAMSHGCVPLAFRGGGPEEIIQHEKNGILWSTIHELVEWTVRLAHDDRLRIQLSNEAIKRASLFSRERFRASFNQVIPAN